MIKRTMSMVFVTICLVILHLTVLAETTNLYPAEDEYGLYGYDSPHKEDAEALLDAIGIAETKGPGFRKQASMWRATKLKKWIDPDWYDTTGIGSAVKQFTGDTEEVLGNLISSQIADNYARVDLYFRDSTGKKAMIGADSTGSVFSKDIVLLQQMVPKGMELVVNQIK